MPNSPEESGWPSVSSAMTRPVDKFICTCKKGFSKHYARRRYEYVRYLEWLVFLSFGRGGGKEELDFLYAFSL